MIPPQERYILSLEQAKKHIQTADHLAYITFPFIKENKLLLKILEELNSSILNIMNAILQYEYLYKRITIYSNSRDNLETFKKISPRYFISNEQLVNLIEILNLAEKHKKSPFEFSKKDKIVIMSDSNQADVLTIEKIKTDILETKDILKKAQNSLKSQV